MKNPGKQFMPSLTAVILLVAAGQLEAGTTIYTYGSVQPETKAEWSHDFVLPKFDPSLGTLEAVRITADFDITTSASLYNTSQSAKSFCFEEGSLLSLSLPKCLGTLKVSLFAGQHPLQPRGARFGQLWTLQHERFSGNHLHRLGAGRIHRDLQP